MDNSSGSLLEKDIVISLGLMCLLRRAYEQTGQFKCINQHCPANPLVIKIVSFGLEAMRMKPEYYLHRALSYRKARALENDLIVFERWRGWRLQHSFKIQ